MNTAIEWCLLTNVKGKYKEGQNNCLQFDFCSAFMQFITRIKNAKSFPELQKVILEAKKGNEFNDGAIHEAVRKLTTRDCKNVKFGYELCRQIPIDSFPSLHRYTLESILNCASQVHDFRLAQKSFKLLKNPKSFDFYYYINSFKNAKANELTREMIEELGSLWKKMELSGNIEHDKHLTQLFCVLSFSKEKQLSLMNYIISKPANSSFTCGLIGNFLKYCYKADDLELARKVWDWGHSIRERERDTFRFFQIWFQFYTLFPPSIGELKNLWSQVKHSGLDYRVELVTSMCKSLSPDVFEQRKFIDDFIIKEPDKSFDCGLLGLFLKHCSETRDLKLAQVIWRWGQSIRDRDGGTFGFFLISFQYYSLSPPSISELKSVWSQVVSSELHERVELVTWMCSALSTHRQEQRDFIFNKTSYPAPLSYHCGVIGTFLSHCSCQNNYELARRVWSWGLDIRERWKGTSQVCHITIQYISICGGFGDLSLLEEVWREAKVFGVGKFIEVKGAYINALAANGAVDRVLEIFGKVPSNSVDEKLLASTLNALSHTGRDLDALSILRRIQIENPKILTVISYTSVIDALARNGNFEMALSLVEEMTSHGIKPNAVTWITILSPCRHYKNLTVALKAFEELQRVQNEPEDMTSAYVLLADVYKSCGDLISYHQLHDERKNKGLFKVQGGVKLCLPNSETMSFYVNEIPSSLDSEVCDQIYGTLDDWKPMLEQMGLSSESVNCRHSEMLALAYAIRVLKLESVHMRKNLRVCLDCHAATIAMSKFVYSANND